MIDELKPYAEYKSTDVPWLGEVPAHWEVRALRTLLKQRNEKNLPIKTTKILSLSIARGVTLYSHEGRGGNKSKSDLSAYKIAHEGDIVLNSMNVVVGAVGLSKYTGAISPVYYALYPRSDKIDIHYYDKVFSNHTFQRYLLIYGKGILMKKGDSGKLNTIRMKISADDLKTIPLALPTLEEQTAIARYLQWKTVQINKFIRNRRRLIEALSEQKQAIINQTVTRGLDPGVPLKPSGIDWHGDIPKHWEVRRLRTVAELRVSNVDKHTKEGEVPVRLCNYTDVYKNTVITADMPFMAATATGDEIEAFRLRIGDVVITKDSEDWQDIGVPALVAETADDLVCGYHLAILRPRPNVAVGRFLAYALQCRGVVAQLNLAAKGVTRYGLSHGAIKAIALPVPPVEEQEPIARHIDEATASLNGAISRATREIDLIREYRTRLIADVVTGKVDVRHLAPPPNSEDVEEAAEELEPLDEATGELEEDAIAGEVAHADD